MNVGFFHISEMQPQTLWVGAAQTNLWKTLKTDLWAKASLSPHPMQWGSAAQASTLLGFISWTSLGHSHLHKVHREEQLSFSSRALQLKYQVSLQASTVFLYLMGFKPNSQKKCIFREWTFVISHVKSHWEMMQLSWGQSVGQGVNSTLQSLKTSVSKAE